MRTCMHFGIKPRRARAIYATFRASGSVERFLHIPLETRRQAGASPRRPHEPTLDDFDKTFLDGSK